MKIAKIEREGRTAAAVIDGEMVRVIGPWSEGASTATPFPVTGLSPADLKARSGAATDILRLEEIKLVPPISPLSKLICIGLNYRSHLQETLNDAGDYPGLFLKFADVLVGQGEPMIRPKVSTHFDFEGEITVVIGKPARHVARAEAMDCVFGYTIMNDGSLRDYQKQHSVTSGKNFWRSGSLGPWIVTADEIPDPARLKLETRLSGQVVQSATADLMVFDIPALIEYVSRWTLLMPGDVIATGTPAGVGSRRTPPLWMRPGDTIEVEVSGIGVLSNPVEEER